MLTILLLLANTNFASHASWFGCLAVDTHVFPQKQTDRQAGRQPDIQTETHKHTENKSTETDTYTHRHRERHRQRHTHGHNTKAHRHSSIHTHTQTHSVSRRTDEDMGRDRKSDRLRHTGADVEIGTGRNSSVHTHMIPHDDDYDDAIIISYVCGRMCVHLHARLHVHVHGCLE